MSISVSVCIANYRQDQFLQEAIESIKMQTYPCEIHIYNDTEGVGSGEAFNRAIALSNADVVVLLCADDVFNDKHVISDIMACFEHIQEMGHVSRYYHQFVDGDRHPVRAWRGENIAELANNPSGLAFRRTAIQDKKLTNKMFVEAPVLVNDVIKDGWAYSILRYDTVAVRVHKSTARSKSYYAKMWTSSPVEEWAKLGWKTNDFTHLIQVKNYFTTKAVLIEIKNFIRVNIWNVFRIDFIFFSLVALLTPRLLLRILPEIYRASFGKWTTRQVMREK